VYIFLTALNFVLYILHITCISYAHIFRAVFYMDISKKVIVY
jgi:hypothetical protein